MPDILNLDEAVERAREKLLEPLLKSVTELVAGTVATLRDERKELETLLRSLDFEIVIPDVVISGFSIRVRSRRDGV
jgi:hypothetical protein